MKYYDHLSRKDKKDKFVKLWEKLEDEDWLLITEMEVLMRDIAKYSTGKVQKSGTLPSENIVFRALALKVTSQKKFKKYPLCRWNQTITLDTMTKSETIKACELSALGNQCLLRIKDEIRNRYEGRYDDPSFLIPLLLDPRTANCSESWLNSQKSNLFNEVKVSLAKEIESCLQVMYPDNKDAEESKADISDSESSSSSNMSDDFLNPVLQTSSGTMLNGKANAIIDQWIKHCSTIDWKLYRSENITDQVNEKMRLIEVLQDADPFIWFRKHGHLFPCISLLAREQFSKMDSTAVQ